jgi:hypothetical protein
MQKISYRIGSNLNFFPCFPKIKVRRVENHKFHLHNLSFAEMARGLLENACISIKHETAQTFAEPCIL